MYHLLFKKFYKCNGKVKHYMSSYFQLQIEKTDAGMPRLNLYKGDRTCCLLLPAAAEEFTSQLCSRFRQR